MSKALIEKAFEKWAEKHKTGVESKRDEVTAKTAFIAGATFMAEEIERIINKYGVDNLDAGDILGFIQELKK
jgi:hypothetical protein